MVLLVLEKHGNATFSKAGKGVIFSYPPKVNNITEKEYFVRGSTALLDAIGKTIVKEKAIQDTLGKNEKRL